MQQVLKMQSISCFLNMYEEVLGVFVTCMRVSAGPLNVKKKLHCRSHAELTAISEIAGRK